MRLNKVLIRQVAQKLRRLRHEEHYNQAVVIAKTECGTAACIAGHTLIEIEKRNGASGDAAEALGLTVRKAARLFCPDPDFCAAHRWPKAFAERWAGNKERRSRIAADLLDAIADGKVEL